MCIDRQRGVSLVELIIFIVVVGVAVAGVVAALRLGAATSTDPMVHKQALAIAEALLEEVELQPFTYCDPNDANAASALSTAACTTPEVIGVEGGETRGSITTPFDNVSDYHNPVAIAVSGIDGVAIAGLGAYTAVITVTAQDLGGITAASAEALLIRVEVSAPAGVTVVLDGYRTRYAPNALP